MSRRKTQQPTNDSGSAGLAPKPTRYGNLRQSHADGSALWTMVEPAVLARAIGLVIAVGDAITISQTRDGGAGCICILTEGEQVKVYGSTADELTELLELISDGCQEAVMRAAV